MYCITGVQHFEAVRVATGVEKRSRRKGSTSQSVPAAESSDTRPFTCDDCGRQFAARTGLISHMRCRGRPEFIRRRSDGRLHHQLV